MIWLEINGRRMERKEEAMIYKENEVDIIFFLIRLRKV